MIAAPAIRFATPADAAAMRAIYAPSVTASATSFETEVPSVAAFAERVRVGGTHLPWLACVEGEALLGYAYASVHRTRAAYRWTCEVSVYVREGARRRGVGRGLYASLLALLEQQGYRHAYAGIALPNAASVALHESLGFVRVALYPRIGYKHGAWHDVGWWGRTLGTLGDDVEPPSPRPIGELARGDADAALVRGATLVR